MPPRTPSSAIMPAQTLEVLPSWGCQRWAPVSASRVGVFPARRGGCSDARRHDHAPRAATPRRSPPLPRSRPWPTARRSASSSSLRAHRRVRVVHLGREPPGQSLASSPARRWRRQRLLLFPTEQPADVARRRASPSAPTAVRELSLMAGHREARDLRLRDLAPRVLAAPIPRPAVRAASERPSPLDQELPPSAAFGIRAAHAGPSPHPRRERALLGLLARALAPDPLALLPQLRARRIAARCAPRSSRRPPPPRIPERAARWSWA